MYIYIYTYIFIFKYVYIVRRILAESGDSPLYAPTRSIRL